MASAPKFVDRVQAASTTTGTGTYTLGAAITGFQSFAGLGDGNSCYYVAQDVDGSGNPTGGWEVGVGTYTASGTTLSRDRIDASSNAGAAVSWAAGTRRISVVASAMLFSGLIPAEIAITGAVTLTAVAWGKSYVCTGTSADYTVGLPTAVGHAGERIKIRMSNALTKLVTLDGNASETLDGSLTRILWAGESCEVLSDGTNLVKVGGVSRPMGIRLKNTNTQGCVANTWTAVVLDALVYGTPQMQDATNGRATIVRPGAYRAMGAVHISDSTGLYLNVGLNGPSNTAAYTSSISSNVYNGQGLATSYVAAIGDYLVVGVYGPNGSFTVDNGSGAAFLDVAEVFPW